MFVDAGADISADNEESTTPLLAACAVGNLELAKMLVDAGARVSAPDHSPTGHTPLFVCGGQC